MGPLSKKAWWQKVLLSRVTLILLLIATVGLIFAVFDRYQVERDMQARREHSLTNLKREIERQEVLQDRVEYLNNEQGMEAEIRRHFDVALEGEQVVVIVDEEESTNITDISVDANNASETEGFWERWWPF